MNMTGVRRWALPIYATLLVLWTLALVVSYVAFDGPTSPVHWVTVVVTFAMLVVLIAAELKARREP
jgi:peptidoglycan/LPS O-acetylase OafA/YrhL